MLADVVVPETVGNPAEEVAKWDALETAEEAAVVLEAEYLTVLYICLFKAVCLIVQADGFSFGKEVVNE